MDFEIYLSKDFHLRKICFTLLLNLLISASHAQFLESGKTQAPVEPPRVHPWWNLYFSIAEVPPEVKIGAPGIGWGTSLLFPTNNKIYDYQVPAWLGVEFSYHYFGTETIDNFKTHYENWQLGFLARITSNSKTRVKPFMDVEIGCRYLVGLTTDNRDYAGVIFRRGLDAVVLAVTNGNGPTAQDYNIVREYGKLSFMGSISPGVTFFSRSPNWSGINIQACLQYGTNTHFLNRDSLHTVSGPLLLSPQVGSGLMYSLKVGFTI